MTKIVRENNCILLRDQLFWQRGADERGCWVLMKDEWGQREISLYSSSAGVRGTAYCDNYNKFTSINVGSNVQICSPPYDDIWPRRPGVDIFRWRINVNRILFYLLVLFPTKSRVRVILLVIFFLLLTIQLLFQSIGVKSK